MITVHFATGNGGKLASAQAALAPMGIEVISVNLDLPEPQSDDLRAIALAKSQFAFEKIRRPVIAQDAGFYVDALNGFPGAFTKFVLNTIGIGGILKLAKGETRSCAFRNCLAYCDGDTRLFEDEIRGTLSEKPLGTVSAHAWSPLWQVFIPAGSGGKTLAQMTESEFERWRRINRANSAFAQFGRWLVANRGQP